LQPPRILARENPVVEGLIGDALLLELALNVLVPVQAELGVVRKVGTEL